MTDLSNLNGEQKEAVLDFSHNLLILACAGSGKTRTITEKIAYAINEGIYKPWQILAVTFTNRAANEMRERVHQMLPGVDITGLEMRTFHSFGAYLLRRYGTKCGLAEDFCIYDDSDSLSLLDGATTLDRKALRTVVKAIGNAKDKGLTPESPDLSAILPEYDFPTLFAKYQETLAISGNADFSDLISLPVKLLRDDMEVREAMHRRFRMILVDEYQDSNRMQFELLSELRGENTQIVAVGDDDQSIYSFRGAEIENILTFASSFDNVREIKLEKNYRSTSEILSASAALISHNKERHKKDLVSAEGLKGAKPSVMCSASGRSEAERIANLIKGIGDYDSTAVLYRTNAQSQAFERAFTDFRIPYKVIGALRFYEREEVKDALAFLYLLVNHRDTVSFRRIINKPSRGIGEKKIEKIISSDPDLIKGLELYISSSTGTNRENALIFFNAFQNADKALSDDGNLGDLLEKALSETMLLDYYNSEPDKAVRKTKIENLGELVSVLKEAGTGRVALSAFLEKLTLDTTVIGSKDPRDAEGVTLMTMHNTKGLEFDRVFVVGLEDEVIPGRSTESDMETEEERRIMYVAMTRARKTLYLSFAAQRSMWGRGEYHSPSRFLQEIPRPLLAGDATYLSIGAHRAESPSSCIGSSFAPKRRTEVSSRPSWSEGIVIRKKGEEKRKESFVTFSPGDRVRSVNYGIGTVRSIEVKNGRRILQIDFNGRMAKFIEAYAALEKVD